MLGSLHSFCFHVDIFTVQRDSFSSGTFSLCSISKMPTFPKIAFLKQVLQAQHLTLQDMLHAAPSSSHAKRALCHPLAFAATSRDSVNRTSSVASWLMRTSTFGAPRPTMRPSVAPAQPCSLCPLFEQLMDCLRLRHRLIRQRAHGFLFHHAEQNCSAEAKMTVHIFLRILPPHLTGFHHRKRPSIAPRCPFPAQAGFLACPASQSARPDRARFPCACKIPAQPSRVSPAMRMLLPIRPSRINVSGMPS